MKIDKIKTISIVDFLEKRNCFPRQKRRTYNMYLSPLREEQEPSFKVDFNKNLWYDFGSGEGGSIIDLVMKFENCSIKEAINRLDNQTDYSTNGMTRYTKPEKEPPLITIHKIQPLKNKSLTYYLYQRKIKISTARKYCGEVYYSIHDKLYYAIGFRNDSGGYELRNRYFKGSTNKDVTTFQFDNNKCLIFEGFFDFLSFLTFEKIEYTENNVIVLNSTVNCRKILKELSGFENIYTYLNNDPTGKKTLELIKTVNNSVIDQSNIYLPYNDFNDFICGKT